MNKSNIAAALLSNVSAVEVVFTPSNGTYTYLAHNMDLEVGDRVVVDTPNSGMVVVTVKKVNVSWDVDAKYTYKFIVDKVDSSKHAELTEAMAEITAELEAARREQARAAMLANLNLKDAQLKAIKRLDTQLLK